MFTRFLIASLLLAAATADAGPLVIAPNQVQRKGSAVVSQAAEKPSTISIRFDDPGWDSGVRLLPPQDQTTWDLSGGRTLAIDVENRSADKQLRLVMQISSGSKETKTYAQAYSGIALNPGETRTLRLPIPHRRLYAVPAGIPGPKLVDSDKITAIELFMQWPFEGVQKNLVDCQLSNLRLEDEAGAKPVATGDAFFPFIDNYGQYIHTDWPAKIHTDADLKKTHAAELAELAASKQPAEWNRYGGWANGPQLNATGYFRTEKYQDKWWLVDPDGRLFFSQGIDVLYAHTDATLSKDHDRWFSFPVTGPSLPFNDWNLQKKYGKKDYDADFYDTLVKRLGHWGINTIGNWGKSDLILLGRLPYTLQLSDYNAKLPRIAGSKLKFYDVFDPAYVQAMETLVSSAAATRPEVAKSLTDPLCIGYFIDNELNFGNRGERQILGDEVLRSPATQASKLEFIKDLKANYTDIARLNAAWETAYADWDALLNGTAVPQSKGYRTDSNRFFAKTVEQYFRLCHNAVKTAAPHRLYLGCRFISTDAVRKVLYEASAKYCDVLTVNIYAHSAANIGIGRFPDMPVLIGEFHFGVRDRGLFSAGLAPAGLTQDERALAYTRFLQGALVHPNIVGAHWFQFRDQPLTGRWDGEGYEIGFVDVADTPYAELTRAAREVGEHMYDYRLRGRLTNSLR